MGRTGPGQLLPGPAVLCLPTLHLPLNRPHPASLDAKIKGVSPALSLVKNSFPGFLLEDSLGASEYGVFTGKCRPAFEKLFGFVPCYGNSRLALKGMPVASKTNIYGALSAYMVAAATLVPPTILDINNTAPADMLDLPGGIPGGYAPQSN